MKLANRMERRYFRGIGLSNPFYHVSAKELAPAVEHAHDQHSQHESPQQIRARALARVVWRKRFEQRHVRRLLWFILALLGLILLAHREGYAQGNVVVRQSDGTKLHMICDSGCGGAVGAQQVDLIKVNGTTFSTTNPLFVTPATGANFTVTASGNLGRTWSLASGTDSVAAAESGTWTVQPGNTANSTAWLVTGTGGTFPASESGTWTVQPGNTANTTPWLVTARVVGNAGATVDAAPGAALPTNALAIAGRDSTQTGGGMEVPVVCDKSAAITAAAVASTVIIALAASKTTYICGFVVTGAGAAGTLQWKSGTGTTCGTSTTTLTGTMATAIGGTISYGNGMGTVMRDAAAAQDTCITMATTSATAAGVVTYAQF